VSGRGDKDIGILRENLRFWPKCLSSWAEQRRIWRCGVEGRLRSTDATVRCFATYFVQDDSCN